MQINNKIIFLFFQAFGKIVQTAFQVMDLIYVRIGNQHRSKLLFCAVMNFSAGNLIFEATDYRRGKHDVANRTKTYDKYFFQFAVFVQT